jgi:hypothetical protein
MKIQLAEIFAVPWPLIAVNHDECFGPGVVPRDQRSRLYDGLDRP